MSPNRAKTSSAYRPALHQLSACKRVGKTHELAGDIVSKRINANHKRLTAVK